MFWLLFLSSFDLFFYAVFPHFPRFSFDDLPHPGTLWSFRCAAAYLDADAKTDGTSRLSFVHCRKSAEQQPHRRHFLKKLAGNNISHAPEGMITGLGREVDKKSERKLRKRVHAKQILCAGNSRLTTGKASGCGWTGVPAIPARLPGPVPPVKNAVTCVIISETRTMRSSELLLTMSANIDLLLEKPPNGKMIQEKNAESGRQSDQRYDIMMQRRKAERE